jgi:hypothetical protein
MQMEFSFEFAAALEAHRTADEAFTSEPDVIDENGEEAPQRHWPAVVGAIDALLRTPAGTVAGLREKLAMIDVVEICDWHDWPEVQGAIKRDLLELRRPNSTLHAPFEAWRAAYEAYALVGDAPDEISDPPCRASYDAAGALIAAPCASPGDFLVKAYVSLLCEHGYAPYDDAGLDGGDNFWDIDIQQADHPTYLTDAWERSAYHDLDMSDLGACLLAFGRLDFSPEDWLRRARALKVPISLAVTVPNEWSLHAGPFASDDGCERRQRERARLKRLLEFDPARRKAVIDVILRDWPLPDPQLAKAA